MRLAKGSSVGPYIIDRLIGSGPMSIVYLAEEPKNRRTVALKLFARALTFNAFGRAQFLGDVDAVNAISHPNIVQIHHFGQHREQVYMAMPFLSGGSLADILTSGSKSAALATDLLRPAANALDAAHETDRLHSNLKPSNVLFDDVAQTYVSDFSIGEMQSANSGFVGAGGIGNISYFSPEQVRGEPLTKASDIYAFAVLLFELVGGRKPFGAESAELIGQLHVAAPIPKLDNALDDVFLSGLAKQPKARPATANALLDLIPDEATIAASQKKPRRSNWLKMFKKKKSAK